MYLNLNVHVNCFFFKEKCEKKGEKSSNDHIKWYRLEIKQSSIPI